MQPAICVVDTDTRVEYVATLGAATGEGSFEIRLVDTSINVAVTNVTSGFTRNNGALTAEASYPGGTPAIDGPARTWDWTAAGDFPASATSQVDTDDTSTLAATFAFDGTYCPMNVIVTDEGGRMGVSQDGCFIIDRTRPRSTMQPVLTFASAADPRVLRTVDPADTSTYPQFFIGEDIPLDRLLALDVDGASSAGFGSVTVSVTRHVDQNSPTATELFSSSSASTFADGVFRTRGPTSLQLTCNDPAYCTAGALDLAKVDRGFHRLEIVTVDLAGNEGRSTQHMRVIDFADAATQASTWVSTLRADRMVPFRSALGDLGNRLSYARDTAKTAPGQAYALAAGVTTELASQQVATGSDDANFVIEYLPRGVVSDVRRVVEVAAEQRSGTWDILGPGQYLSSPAFNQTPVVLDVDAVVADAEALIDEAADAYDMKLYGDALAAARGAFNTLNIIGGEDINAIVYGRNAFTVDNGARLEGFYDNNDPVVGPSGGELQAVGRFVVASVAQQVVRARQPAAFASVVRGQTSTAFSNVEARLNTFAAVMQKFPNFNVSNVRTGNRGANQELMEDGYLAVSSALASMADVQGAAFDTGSWRAGLALGLGYIMEFSFFDGTRVISSFRTVSPSVRTFECRFNSIMRDIAENDVDNALDKFDRSTCLLIDTYNEFYPVGTLNVTDRIPDDNCIAPDAHGCPVSTRRFPNGCLAVDQTALVASGRDTSWDPELVGNCGALASCGNGVCDNGETTASCIADCP